MMKEFNKQQLVRYMTQSEVYEDITTEINKLEKIFVGQEKAVLDMIKAYIKGGLMASIQLKNEYKQKAEADDRIG